MRLGIYIGSFNPPHKGHISVVNYLINNDYIDKALIIPTLNYWNKQNLVDLKHRINMLKFYEDTNIKVDIKNNKYAYAYELLRILKKEYSDELYLIIGADNIVYFDKWKNYKELLNYKIIVIARNNIDIDSYIIKYSPNNFIIVNNFPQVNISSNEIRNNLDSKYLDEHVRKYIINNNLYK